MSAGNYSPFENSFKPEVAKYFDAILSKMFASPISTAIRSIEMLTLPAASYIAQRIYNE